MTERAAQVVKSAAVLADAQDQRDRAEATLANFVRLRAEMDK
jgi:hypothetical protein